MIIDEKTYKDVIYKIASEDSEFKKIIDERIDLYKKNILEIEQLKSRAYKFCDIAYRVFKFNINITESLSQDEFIEVVMNKFNKMVSEAVGRAVLGGSQEYKDVSIYRTLESLIDRLYNAELKDSYFDTLKYFKVVHKELFFNIYDKFDEYKKLIKKD